MGAFTISVDDIECATRQMTLPLPGLFGDLEWEQYITKNQDDFWLAIIEIFTGVDNDINNAMRRTLTFVYGAVYHALGGSLPRLRAADWERVQRAYNPQQNLSDALMKIWARNQELMGSVNTWWAHQWESEITRDIIIIEPFRCWQMCAMVCVLLARQLNEPIGTTPTSKSIPDEKLEEVWDIDMSQMNQAEETLIAPSVPSETFADIGGCRVAKEKLRRVALALRHPEVWRSWGTTVPRGILLYGLPGTGKTLCVKALAHETGKRFFYVKASHIFEKWYGESGQNVARIIEDAKKNGGGGILFFDEAEAMFGSRDGHMHEETIRVISTLNASLDGLTRPENLLVVYATNRRDLMDEAVIREGRVDLFIEFPLPNRDDRREILAVHIRKAQKIAGRQLFSKLPKSILDLTNGLSGAALAEIVRRTLERKAELQASSGSVPSPVTLQDFTEMIKDHQNEHRTKQGNVVGFVKE